MSKRELLPVASRWRNGLSLQPTWPETVAMLYVRTAISSSARRDPFFAICALPEMREFRSGSRGARSRGPWFTAIFQTIFGALGIPLRSVSAAVFYRPPIPQDSSVNRSRCKSKSRGIIAERTAGAEQNFARLASLVKFETWLSRSCSTSSTNRENRALQRESGVLTLFPLTADPIAPGGRAIDY
jgi:hypothetical protein